MPRIGVTGHIRLTDRSAELIYDAIDDALRAYPGPTLCGVTCLAGGADQLFARAVLARQGTIDVVLPARTYRATDIPPDGWADFDDLLAQASRVSILPYETAGHAAYLAASRQVLDRSDVLLAVWDQGEASYTGTVVDLARRQGKQVKVVWPSGAARLPA